MSIPSLFAFALILASLASLQAQSDTSERLDPPPVGEPATSEAVLATDEERTPDVEILRSLQNAILSKQEQILKLETELADAQNDVAREDLKTRINAAAGELSQLERRFEEAATSVDISLFVEETEKPFSWEEELGSILKPVFAEIDKATEETRKIAALRESQQEFAAKQETAERALSNLKSVQEAAVNPQVKEQLQALLDEWQRRASYSENQVKAATLQLNALEAKRQSVLKSSTTLLREFVNTRGLNLLLAMIAFGLVFFGIRFGYSLWMKTRKKTGKPAFSDRLSALLVHAVSIVGAIAAVMIVFNLRGDLFLLGIVLIFLIGIAWASAKTLPQYLESIKLILNLGSVREDEVLIYEGIPWHVTTIGFQSILTNEALEGGMLRIPVKYLVGLISRPIDPKESLFPTKVGDWVQLGDTVGEVVRQTPIGVSVREPGGADHFYPIADFLTGNPRNLSHGYRIETFFGIDYRHQPIATTEVVDKMKSALTAGLPSVVAEKHIRRIGVLLARAGASSLDYEIEIDLTGDAASEFDKIEFAAQRILVDACNEHGWTIPFPQLTIHQATAQRP